MKKLMALVLVCVLTLGSVGAQAFSPAPGSALSASAVPALGSAQTIGGKALSQKVSASLLEVPKMAERKSNVTVYSNTKAVVDASNANEGYLDIRYTGGKKVKIMVQIALTSDNPYNYNLNSDGKAETFALSEGNGKYTVRVLENTSGNKYACVYSCEIEVKLRSELLPFLYSNNTVNYAAAPETVKKAAELTKDVKDDLSKIDKIYHFVTGNLTYDYDFAKKVVSGQITSHIPNLDATLKSGKGICFDYASLMAGMLRSQGIPCRLVKGYAGTTYHAWINVYIAGVGWIDKVIQFDGTNWTMMDPTYVSTSKNADAVKAFIGEGNSYSPKQVY